MVSRRHPNPIALLGAIIAVVIAAWLTNSGPELPPVPQTANQPRVEQPRAQSPRAEQPRVEREEEPPVQRNAEDPQLAETLALIERGGPYPYRQDGTVFQNREGRLPSKPRGYYREYTVKTPGAQNRGARRVVVGKDGDKWYTRDHYKTFVRLD